MSKIIGDSVCEVCYDRGGDRTMNHRILFEDGGSWCSRCRTNGLREGSGLVKCTEVQTGDTSMQLQDIQNLKPAPVPSRGLTAETLQHYGMVVDYNEETREVNNVYSPITSGDRVVGYEAKRAEQGHHPYRVGSTKGIRTGLFGQQECTSFHKLWIFEGAFDACSAAQVLREYGLRRGYKEYPSCVALLGSDKLSVLSDNSDFLSKFKEVNICLDNDEAGNKATKKIKDLYPEWKVWSVNEGMDANQMLIDGKKSELINALFNTKVTPPDSIVTTQDAFNEAIELPKWGRLWPWPSLNRLTYGRRGGEGIYIGAAVKAGKTEWKNQMAEHIIVNEGLKIFSCSFEQSPGIQVKAVAGKLKNKQFHNPEHVDQGKFTQEDLTKAVKELDGKIIMFKASFADVGAGNMWDRLKPAIRHAVVVEGVKDVFIDPITQLTDGLTPSETETELRRFSNEIQGMAQELDFFYYCFAHLKEPPQGKTHEEGGAVKVAQFRGSRAMAEKTKFLLGIIRNQFSDDTVERNTSTFHLLLNSGFGKSGKFEVMYNEETGSYLEPENEFSI